MGLPSRSNLVAGTILFTIVVGFIQLTLISQAHSQLRSTENYVPIESENKNSSKTAPGQLDDFQKCRLGLEQWLGPKIDDWLEADLPLLDWVWIREEKDKNNDDTVYSFYQAMFQVVHLNKERRHLFHTSTWYCQDEQQQLQLASTNMIENKIRDKIFVRCNTNKSFVPTHIYPSGNIFGNAVDAPPTKYELTPILKCDRLELAHSPSKKKAVKFGACLKFRGDGDRKLIPQWIEYHRLIGIQHFWVFVNEPFDLKRLPVVPDDVTFIPYNYTWRDHGMNHSTFRAYRNGNNFWQSPALNQCLYKAKRYGVEWFITTDTDEYVWVTDQESTTKNFPLQSFLEKLSPQTRNVGALIMNSIPFGRNKKLEHENKTFELTMDYTYRHQQDTPWDVKHHRWKCIYHSPVAELISVHNLDQGGEKMYMDATTHIRVNHYKDPAAGVYQAISRKQKADSSLPDKYRKLVLEALSKK